MKLTLFEIGVFVSIVLGIATVIYLLFRSVSTIRAQRELEKRLRTHHQRASLLRLAEQLSKRDVDLKIYADALKLVVKELDHLDPATQKRLWPGLSQPSEQGRFNFCAHVLRESAHAEEADLAEKQRA